MKIKYHILASCMAAISVSNAALVVTEFGLSPDGQEFVVIENTVGSASIDLSTVTISVDNGATTASIADSSSGLDAGEKAIVARQELGDFIGTYTLAPVVQVAYRFFSVSSLDFVDGGGASSIILDDGSSGAYTVDYGGGGYTGDLCIVDNSGLTPSTSANTTAFATVPEPSIAVICCFGALAMLRRQRRAS